MFDHASGATPRTDAPHTAPPCTDRSDADGPRTGRVTGTAAGEDPHTADTDTESPSPDAHGTVGHGTDGPGMKSLSSDGTGTAGHNTDGSSTESLSPHGTGTDGPGIERPRPDGTGTGGTGTHGSGTDAPRTESRTDVPGTETPRPDGTRTTRSGAPAAVRFARVLLSPWARLALLLVVLASAATAVLLYEPQKMLADGWPPQLSGAMAAVLFGVAYGLCTVAFVPRPILNLAAGALFGTALGLTTSIGGTVLGAGISFGLGRLLGQDALRPMLRGRVLLAADGVLSRHGFRSMLAIRLFPGVPFAAANYCAAVSRMRYLSFLTATGLGSIPNTLAYVIAGSEASSPTSPAFLISTGFIVVSSIAGVVVAWCKRHSIGRSAVPASADAPSDPAPERAKAPALPLSHK
ncbi:hypothetical protein GCM10018987_48170 [Streptomyces cremeus]